MGYRKNIHASVTIAGSGTTLIILIGVWCFCAAPYNAMREATLDAIEAKAYAARQSDSAEKARAEAILYAKRWRADLAYLRLPFFMKWLASRPSDEIDNISTVIESDTQLAEE